MFYVVKKSQLIIFALLIVVLAAAICFSASSGDENAALCRNFLKDLGYSFERTTFESSEIIIPEGFGKVYESYNALQKEAGFDLTPLRGKTVMRYSFHLKNEDYSIANILVSDGKICGGDILDPSISGKMIPLIPKEKE